MNQWNITNVRAMQPGSGIVASSISVCGGKILELNPKNVESDKSSTHIDGKGCLLSPGLIDIHTHGIKHSGYEDGLESFFEAVGALVSYGTTCILPTIVPNPNSPDWLGKLSSIADAVPHIKDICIPGLHLEGPFVAIGGAACKPVDGDVTMLDAMLEACNGKVAAMSIAPDVPNIIAVIERLIESSVVPFITHTQATVEQTQAAIDAGARHATHFYDVFYPPERKDGGVHPAGAVEAILADNRCSVDFICDGVHVHPVTIQATLAAKGYESLVLITDSNIGTGLPEGTYDTPWGFSVRVEYANGLRNADRDHPGYGRLAGSVLTMDAGINNLMKWLDIPPCQVWAMGTLNPARLMNLKNKGIIQPGADADLVLWDETEGGLVPVQTWVGGRCVWKKDDLRRK